MKFAIICALIFFSLQMRYWWPLTQRLWELLIYYLIIDQSDPVDQQLLLVLL